GRQRHHVVVTRVAGRRVGGIGGMKLVRSRHVRRVAVRIDDRRDSLDVRYTRRARAAAAATGEVERSHDDPKSLSRSYEEATAFHKPLPPTQPTANIDNGTRC